MSKPTSRDKRQQTSLEDQLKEAGRKALHATLSVVLAASLVPVAPQMVYAGDSEPVETEEGAGKKDETPAGETPAGETPAGEDPKDDEESKGGEDPKDDEESKSGEESKGGETPGEGAKKGGETPKSEEPKSEEPKGEEPKDEEPAPDEETVNLTAKAAIAGNPTTVEKDDKTYYAAGTKIEITFEGLPEGAVLNLEGVTIDDFDLDNNSLDKDGDKLVLTLNQTGTYKDFAISGVKVTQDDTEKDATVTAASLDEELNIDADIVVPASSLEQVLGMSATTPTTDTTLGQMLDLGVGASMSKAPMQMRMLGAPAPSTDTLRGTEDSVELAVTSVKLLNDSATVKEWNDLEGDITPEETYINVTSVEVTVNASKLDANASKVKLVNSAGDEIKSVDIVGPTATINDIPEGVCGIVITIKNQDDNSEPLTRQIAVADDGKADGNLIIDCTAPALSSAKIGNTTLNPEAIESQTCTGNGVYAQLSGQDDSFDYARSFIVLNKQQLVKAAWGDNSSAYFPIDKAGTYVLDIFLYDKAGNCAGPTCSDVTVEMASISIADITSRKLDSSTLPDTPYFPTDANDRVGGKSVVTRAEISGISVLIQGPQNQEPKIRVAGKKDATFNGSTDHAITLASTTYWEEGTYQFWLEDSDAATANLVDPNDKWTVEVDGTAPKAESIDATSGVKDETTGFYKKDGDKDVTVTVTVDEPHMVETGDNGVKVDVSASDNRQLVAGTDYVLGDWTKNAKTGKWTRTVAFKTDGDYKVEATSVKDQVQNVPPAADSQVAPWKRELTIGVDNLAPKVEPISVTSGTEGLDAEGHGTGVFRKNGNADVCATVTVDEAHMIASVNDGVEVAVSATDGRKIHPGTDYVLEADWTQIEGTTKWTRTVTFKTDGDYKVEATSVKDQVQNVPPAADSQVAPWKQELTLGVDNSAPSVIGEYTTGTTTLKVLGKPSETVSGLYAAVDANDPVAVSVAVEEAHFLPWVENDDGTDNGGTHIVVKNGDGADATIIPEKDSEGNANYTIWWHPSLPLAKFMFPKDGTYCVTATAGKDAVGNSSDQTVTTGVFMVDNKAPIVEKAEITSGTEGRDKWNRPTGVYKGDVAATITVDEAHMIATGDDGVKVEVTAADERQQLVPEIDYVLDEKWTKNEETGKWTRGIRFISDGDYKVEATSVSDQVQNPLTTLTNDQKSKTLTVKVGNNAPIVTTEWVGDAPTPADKVGDTQYYGQELTIKATIKNSQLDARNTTLNGTALSDILDAVWRGQPEIDGVKYSVEGTRVERIITMTYSDRLNPYATPIVEAYNNTGYMVTSAASDANLIPGANSFIVDTVDPAVIAQYISISPLSDSRIGLGSQSGAEQGYYFFRSDNKGNIHVTIQEREIRSLAITDPSGYYAKVFSEEEIKNSRKTEYKYEFDLATLTEEHFFKNDIVLTVTDHAGRTCSWTIDTAGHILNAPNANRPIGPTIPKVLVEDDTKPVLAFSGFQNGKLADYPRFVNQTQTITLTVTEPDYDLIHRLDAARPLYTVTSPSGERSVGVGSQVGQTSYDETFEAKADHSNDGTYKLDASLTDFVGLTGTASEAEFVIDTTAPEVTVTYDNNNAAHGNYYNAPRTATIRVVEKNFAEELFTIDVAAPTECARGTATPQPTAWTHDGDVHTCTVTFSADARYTLSVSGQDKAGNAAVVQDFQREFVVDNTAPAISNDFESIEPTGTFNGMRYYSHAIQVTTTIVDRNLDESTVSIWDPDGKEITFANAGWSKSGPNENGEYTYTHVMTIDEANGDRLTPQVTATDLGGLNSTLGAERLVIDKTAPTIRVTVDQDPTSTGADNEGDDPIQFFNQATSMTFSVSDIHQLRRAWIIDPDDEYTIERADSITEGATEGIVVVALRDGTESNNDTEYERPILFTVEDIAGNQHTWTIDRQGNVLLDNVTTAEDNASINDDGIYPLSLILDQTAPSVTLEGVNAGQYYNTPQTVRATVDEFNFGYLQRFAGGRSIVTVTKYEGNASRAQSSWEIAAAQFEGERPIYTFDQPFEGDGHYIVHAEFDDYANNHSNVAEIGEFTIDRTPPTITVTWDNNDARNGNHYRAGRTATITVVEHNFNPSDFVIDAPGGSISGWSHDGDTHTATVRFDNDGSFTLKVSGKDMASNEAVAYSEPTFIIDTKMPAVSFKGKVQRYGVTTGESSKESSKDSKDTSHKAFNGDITTDGESPKGRSGDEATTEKREDVLQDHHAYNGEVSPIIVFRDDNSGDGTVNYDAGGVSYTITDGGGKDVTSKFTPLEVRGGMTGDGNGQEVSFGNLGLIKDENGQGVVDENSSTPTETHYVYDPSMDGIYTIKATMTDLAGNRAENDITFSVNRYGSTYTVEVLDVDGNGELKTRQGIDGLNYHIIPSAPRIVVHEINVSGSESEDDHQVRKEYANASKDIEPMSDAEAKSSAMGVSRPAGYRLDTPNKTSSDFDEVSEHGWSEYVYTIREGNFGIGSDSDNQDRGQGDYRVNVYSIDRATNDVGTDNYLDATEYNKNSESGRMRGEREIIDAARRNAQVSFRLDEIGPAIEDVKLPAILAPGTTYNASFYVNDVITDGDTVEIYLDGRKLEQGEYTAPTTRDGTGMYSFVINSSMLPFALHDVRIKVSDSREAYEGHETATFESPKFLVSILVPEILAIALVAGAVVGGVVYFRKRKAAAEPEKPGSYE